MTQTSLLIVGEGFSKPKKHVATLSEESVYAYLEWLHHSVVVFDTDLASPKVPSRVIQKGIYIRVQLKHV